MGFVVVGLILFISFVWWALITPRSAFNFTLLAIMIWPSYIVYKAGSLPGISPDRILIFALVLVFFVHFFLRKNSIATFREYGFLFKLILGLFCWQLLGAFFVATDVNRAVFGVLNDFISAGFLSFYVLFFFKDNKQAEQIINMLFFALILINSIGLVEVFYGKPLFTGFMISVTEFNEWVKEAKMRNGSYRIMSVFSNALVYSQFLVLSTPLMLRFILVKDHSYIFRTTAKIFLILTCILQIFTQSRAGLLLLVSVPVLLFYIKLYKSNNRIFLRFINYLLLPTIGIFILYYLSEIFSKTVSFDISTSSSSNDNEMSTLARIAQLQRGVNALMESPFFGYGFGGELAAINLGRSDEIDNLRAIDNLYVSVALASGVVGFFFFILINVYVVRKSMNGLKFVKDDVSKYYLASFVLLLLHYLILSINQLNVIYYVLIAIIFIRYKNRVNQVSFYKTPNIKL